MMRLFVVVFFGKGRSQPARASQESATSMLVPLGILAIFALIAGFSVFARHFVELPHEDKTRALVPMLAFGGTILGAASAIFLYRGRTSDPISIPPLRDKLYFDETYRALINVTQEFLARVAAFIDRWLIDGGAVRGSTSGVWGFGSLLRLMQVGNLQAYAFIFGLGIIWLIYFVLFR
jgi:NADH-quinone oxidoreductase subunit L